MHQAAQAKKKYKSDEKRSIPTGYNDLDNTAAH